MSAKKSSTSRKKSASQFSYSQQVHTLERGIEKAKANDCYDLIRAAKIAHIKALATVDYFNIAPAFIRQAIAGAIAAAVNATGLPLPDLAWKPTKPDIENYVSLFATCDARNFLITSPQKTLAEMIVEVLEHDDCPTEIWNGISEATSDLFNNLRATDERSPVYFTAPYIHALIVESKAREGSAQ